RSDRLRATTRRRSCTEISRSGSQKDFGRSLNILVFRELSSADKRAFKSHKVFVIPAIKIQPKKFRIPKKIFDYVLVTSANALRESRRRPKTKRWVAVGEATAASLGKVGKISVLNESNSDGVLKFFSKAERGSIFFPRSSLGDTTVVQKLRAKGFKVSVCHSYETKVLNIRAKVLGALRNARMDVFFVTSPSIFSSLRKSFSIRELKGLEVKWVAIGPTTARELRKFGMASYVAQKPTMESMLKAYFKIRD
ncbi:MAG: uroporphyrinogen synthase, partial [Bacteriovoracaceae bacterium]|nr:uroporphyrinogen synthase [Bacteriovoracaceae bacterium]